MAVRLHPPGVDHATRLVADHQYVMDSDWSDAHPTAEEENAYIESHGYEAYGQWHLAVDDNVGHQTKGRYKYLVGDFRRVHRSGLIAATQRAAEWAYFDVLDAASKLLERVPPD